MNIPNAVRLPASELARMFSTVPAARAPRSTKARRPLSVYRGGKRVELAETLNAAPRSVRCEKCHTQKGQLLLIRRHPSAYRCDRCFVERKPAHGQGDVS